MGEAMARDLFSPFVGEEGVDKRLLRVLGLDPDAGYTGCFDKVLDADEGTRFDLYLEARNGRRIFIDLKSSRTFASCDDDERHRARLAALYEPHLRGLVDAKWLEPAAFFANYEIMRKLSYLGRYPDSGIAFVFPRASEALMKADAVIKQIVSKSLAPRVAILYLEFLVERILAAVADDETLHRHYLSFRAEHLLI